MKDHNNGTGNNHESWPYFDQLDAILGTQPSSAPVTLLQSSASMVLTEESEIDGKYHTYTLDNEDPDLTYVEGFTALRTRLIIT